MKLFSRLRQPAPPPSPPPPALAERIASLQSAPADVVVNAALGGDEDSLRIGAIGLLPDGAALRWLGGLAEAPPGANGHTPAAVQLAAQQRLAQLVDEGSLDDPALLSSLALEGTSSRMRQWAAAAIDDPEQLHELLPRLRGKDKAVYRIIRQKCDALLAEQRKADDAARKLAELGAALKQHVDRPHDVLYATMLDALTTQWQELTVRPDPDVARSIEEDIERCREVIAAHEREVARQAAELEAKHAEERQAREMREQALEADRRAAAERADAESRALAAEAEAREAEERARAEQRAAEAQAHSQVGSLVRLSGDALRRGNSRKAARFRQAIDEALQAAPPLPAHLVRSLQQLDDRLNELRQWKDYVVAPKRIELIEEMEALVGSPEDPESLAEHIRALQQEWRTTNKGIIGDPSEDTERFQRAFHAAFKPCQDHFAAQAAIRRANLEARKQVLERLKAFEASQDAEHTDPRLVIQVLREAPREWRSHSPVDREASRPAEIEFQQALDRLRKIPDAWYARNEADRRSLVEQARQFSTMDDAAQAVDGVKRLQAQWKETGPVSRELSQTLWDEFRALCDAVFAKRQQAHERHLAELEAEKVEAVALREKAEQDRRDAEAAESNLLEAGRLVQAYERAVMGGAPQDEREALKNAAEAFIAGVRRWPGGGLQALKNALARAGSTPGSDAAARETALRMLCIRSEIASSTPTPPEDSELRRDYQLRMLATSMGQGSRANDHDWDALLTEWIGTGAIEPATHEDLERRFLRSLAKRPATGAGASPHRGHDERNTRTRRDAGGRNPHRR